MSSAEEQAPNLKAVLPAQIHKALLSSFSPEGSHCRAFSLPINLSSCSLLCRIILVMDSFPGEWPLSFCQVKVCGILFLWVHILPEKYLSYETFFNLPLLVKCVINPHFGFTSAIVGCCQRFLGCCCCLNALKQSLKGENVHTQRNALSMYLLHLCQYFHGSGKIFVCE